ncbi:MAG: hypothetical protein AAF685_10930 [Cyanobacteria bacterium P01_C01_bin.89]
MHVTHRSSFRRSVTLLTAIALPFSAMGCENSAALLPLNAACDGVGVPEAMDYDGTANPTAVAIMQDSDEIAVHNSFLRKGAETASSIDKAQVVLCVKRSAPRTVETCRYIGAKGATIKRQGRGAQVAIVAAKTGQVLTTQQFFEEARECPRTLSFRQGSTPESEVYGADLSLNVAITDWVPGAMTDADLWGDRESKPAAVAENGDGSFYASDSLPSDRESEPPDSVAVAGEAQVGASVEAGDLKAQCEALEAATKTSFRYGYSAQLSAQSGLIDLSKDDVDIRVAARLGKKNMAEDLAEIKEAIAATRAAALDHPELLTFRNQFLGVLLAMEGSLKQFQTLSLAAEPHAEASPMKRNDLKGIAQKMAPLTDKIKKQSEALKEIKDQQFSRCLTLKRS